MQLTQQELLTIGKFCYLFARFERYLISRGFIKPGSNRYFMPNLKEFAKRSLLELPLIVELRKPLLMYRLNNDTGLEEWIDSELSNSTEDIWRKVEQVRHNLVHGAKVLESKERDMMLIAECTNILEAFSRADEEYNKMI